MKLLSFSLLFFLIAGVFQNTYSQCTENLDVSLTSHNTGITVRNHFQSFTATLTGEFTKFSFYKNGISDPGTMVITVYSGEGTSGTQLYQETFTPGSYSNWRDFAFTGESLAYLTAGEKYSVNISVTSTSFSVVGSYTNPYSGGYTNAYSGGNYDWCFKTYVTAIAPDAEITPAGQTNICDGSDVLLSANTDTDFSYQWLKDDVEISGETSSSYTVSEQGDYTIKITRSSDGCSNTSDASYVEVHSPVTASITPQSATTFCENDNVTLSASNDIGYTYQWKVDDVEISGATSQDYIATTSGDYSVQITNACGTQESSYETVLVHSLPTVTGHDVIISEDDPVSALTVDDEGYEYNWYDAETGGTIVASNTISYTPSVEGTWWVEAVNTTTSCTSERTPVSLIISELFDGAALYMNGTDQYVNLGSSDVFNQLPLSNFTVEMWIKTDDDNTRSVLIGNYNDDPSWNIELTDAGYLKTYLNGTSTVDTKFLADNQWHHIAVVVDFDNDNINTYVDGSLSSTGTNSVDVYSVASDRETMLGNDPSSGSYFYKGIMDEVRIWSKALTESEINETIYKKLDGDESNLLAYYDFDEESCSTILDDNTSGDNSGALVNSPVWVAYTTSLAAPDNLSSSNAGLEGFRAEWDAPLVGTATSYTIELDNDEDFSSPETTVSGITELFYDFSGLYHGNTYYYRVLSVNSDGNGLYTCAESETLLKADQTITFDALSDKTYGDVDFTLEATASSGLTVSYSSSDETVAAISGNTVSIVGVGVVNITASQAGNVNYNPADDVVQSLTVKSQTTGIESIANTTISVYPNPTSDKLTIESDKLTIKSVEVLNMTGKSILCSSLSTLSLNNYDNGIYFIKIQTNNGVFIEKIIKQ